MNSWRLFCSTILPKVISKTAHFVLWGCTIYMYGSTTTGVLGPPDAILDWIRARPMGQITSLHLYWRTSWSMLVIAEGCKFPLIDVQIQDVQSILFHQCQYKKDHKTEEEHWCEANKCTGKPTVTDTLEFLLKDPSRRVSFCLSHPIVSIWILMILNTPTLVTRNIWNP